MKVRMEFNFAERWKASQRKRSRFPNQKRISIPLFFCGLLVIAFVVSPFVVNGWLQKNLDSIERNIRDYEDVAAINMEIKQLSTRYSDMSLFLQMLEAGKKDPQAIINKLTERLPEGTLLMSFSLGTDNTIHMTVVVEGPVDLARLWISFRDSELFDEFDISSVSLIDEKQTLDLSFQLNE